MPYDPTAWPTPMHAFRYWMDLAEQGFKDMTEIREAYKLKLGRSGGPRLETALGDDFDYRIAVGDTQWAVSQANMYAAAVQVRMMEAVLAGLETLSRQLRSGD